MKVRDLQSFVYILLLQNSEMTGLRKDLEKHKELLSSSVTKSKWAENKFKAEADQHKVINHNENNQDTPKWNVENAL